MNLAFLSSRLPIDKSWLLPLGVVVFSSAVSCSLVGARIGITRRWSELYLVWNLFLAWLPLLFALTADWLQRTRFTGRWPFVAAALAWLLFFPNAPYILTDLIHLAPRTHGRFWVDLVLILMFALTGLVLGFMSLYLMQQLVARRLGGKAGWVFVTLVVALSGFGVYLGRFLRWNSWDVVFNPLDLMTDILNWLLHLPANPRTAAIPVLFATLLFVAYVMLYALTHLPARTLPGVDEKPRDCHSI